MNTAWLPRQLQNGVLQSRFLISRQSSLRIAGTSEAEPLVSGKAVYSLAISEDKKSKLFGVTFSF